MRSQKVLGRGNCNRHLKLRHLWKEEVRLNNISFVRLYRRAGSRRPKLVAHFPAIASHGCSHKKSRPHQQHVPDCVPVVGTPRCLCKKGFGGMDCGTQCHTGLSGQHCDLDTNECASAPCIYGRCDDSFTDKTVAMGMFRCTCLEGWSGVTCDSCEDDITWSSRCVFEIHVFVPWEYDLFRNI